MQTEMTNIKGSDDADREARAKRALFYSRMFVNISFCCFLFAVGFLSLVLPKPTVSDYEKRELARMPAFSAQELFWGSYLRDVELFYADTFPFRESFVRLGATVNELRGIRVDGVRIIGSPGTQQPDPAPAADPSPPDPTPQQAATPPAGTGQDKTEDTLLAEVSDTAVPPTVEDDGAAGEQTTDGLFIYKNKAMSIFGGNSAIGDRYAAAVNSYAEQFGPEVSTYNIVVPTAIEFGLPDRYKSVTNPQKPAIDHIYNQLNNVTAVDAYSVLQMHSDEYIYFNTDHHWTVLGAYYAYTAFCEASGVEPLSIDDYEIRSLDNTFFGTLFSESNDSKLEADKVDYYIVPVEYTAYRYDSPTNYVETTIWAEYASGVYSYSLFLHGDFPLMRIETSVNNGRKALVVKESYGNAFAPFLIAHYQEVYIVDHRYLDQGLVSVVRNNDIDDVIFINNAFAANTAYHIQLLESLMY